MDDLFEDKIKREVAERVESELRRIAQDPYEVIKAYALALEQEIKKKEIIQKEYNEVSEAHSRLVDVGINHSMRNASKLIKYKRSDGKQVGQNQLFNFLVDMGILLPDLSPKQNKIDGVAWFDVIIEPWQNGGMNGVYQKTVVTGRGLDGISKLLKKHFETWWEK